MKNKTWVKALLFLVVFLCSIILPTIAFAQTREDMGTPEIFSEPGAKILITEVNFKNKKQDFLKFYYESPGNKPFNFKNFEFSDGKTFKKVEKDYLLTSKNTYLLLFKSSDPDNEQNQTLTTDHKGLIATTKQVMIKDPNGKILDAVCWSNSNPPKSEKKALEELFNNGGWASSDPSSCMPSEKISANQSIVRDQMKDTDSAADWTVLDQKTDSSNKASSPPQTPDPSSKTKPPQIHETTKKSGNSKQEPKPHEKKQETPPIKPPPADTEKETLSSGADSSTSESSFISPVSQSPDTAEERIHLQQDPPPKNHKPKSGKTSKSKKTSPKVKKQTTHKKSAGKRKTSEPLYKDGDLSDQIVISEIFPHPSPQKGFDSKKYKWIELSNLGDTPVNLGNWKLVHPESKKKPYVIPDSTAIQAGSALVMKTGDINFPIKNKYDSIELDDPSGNSVQTVEYDEAPKDRSYALVDVEKEDGSTEEQWVWEENPTPGAQNPAYKELTGTITGQASFEQNYNFAIQTADKKEHTVYFQESLVAGPMAKTLFNKGTQIKILGVPLEAPAAHAGTQQATFQNNNALSNGDAALAEKSFPVQLKKFEILKAPEMTTDSNQWPALGIIPAAVVGSAIWFYRKRKKQHTEQTEL